VPPNELGEVLLCVLSLGCGRPLPAQHADAFAAASSPTGED